MGVCLKIGCSRQKLSWHKESECQASNVGVPYFGKQSSTKNYPISPRMCTQTVSSSNHVLKCVV